MKPKVKLGVSKNPFYNALAALSYIIIIVIVIHSISNIEILETSLLMPILFLSLFTLSAAVMGYIFCLQPLRLYLDGKKEEALTLFVTTILIFAIFPLTIIVLYLSRVIR
ncbi:hypothetical protein IT417_02215 [bacterium]|nr:hypothetical protein [bacterium]